MSEIRDGRVDRTIGVGPAPYGLAVVDGVVFVACAGNGTIARIDQRTGRVLARPRVGGEPTAIKAASGQLFVGDANAQTIRVIATKEVRNQWLKGCGGGMDEEGFGARIESGWNVTTIHLSTQKTLNVRQRSSLTITGRQLGERRMP